jgi:amino acid transporter
MAGFPDGGYFGHVSKWTHTPLRAIWLTTIFSILPGLLDFASPVAANAIFSLTAMALDISYIIPIALRRIFQHHPEVHFKPGPFYLGDGLLGWVVNLICIVWTLFVSVIFSLPTVLPVTKDTMNYAAVITGGVVLLAMYAVPPFLSRHSTELSLSPRIWYFAEYVMAFIRSAGRLIMTNSFFVVVACSGRRHYRGPHTYVTGKSADGLGKGAGEGRSEKASVGSEDKGVTT